MRLTKFVIEPGIYCYADEQTGEPRVLEATPDLIRHWHDAGKEMLAAELSIPLPLEHQKEATPKTRQELAAQRLRDNAGHVKDYVLKEGALYADVDVDDEEIKGKIGRGTVKWTSPYFSSFTDGNGKRWENVISHLALTTRPRLTRQKPFPTAVAAALSSNTLDPAQLSRGFSLSRAGKLLLEPGKPPRPAYPMAFSLFTGAAFAEGEPPGANKPEAKGGEAPPSREPAEKDKVTETEAPKTEEEKAKALVDPDGDMKAADVMCHLLEMMGVAVPEGDPESFLERGVMALFEHLKGKMGNDMAEPKTGNLPPDPTKPGATPGNAPSPVRQEQPPLYMGLSLEQLRQEADKVPDPALKGLLQAAFSMQEKNAAQLEGLRKETLSRAGAQRQARVERLQRMVTPAARDKLSAMMSAPNAALSLDDGGNVLDPMASMLEVMESAVKDLPAMLTSPRSALQVHDHPIEYAGGDLTNEQAEQAADHLASRMTVAPKAKAS